MSQQEILAKRYAAGLAEAARDKGEVAAVRTDLRLLTDMLTPRGSMFMPEFRDFMESPLAARSDKLNLAEKVVAAAGIGPTVASFFAILIEKNRVGVIAAISRNYSEISGEMSGELTALVRTARPLSDDQRRKLTQALSHAIGSPVRIHQRVEPGLLAGAKVTVGDRTFDGSVLGRLDGLRHRLEAGGYAAGANAKEE